MNYKRKKPKLHLIVDCCRAEAWRDNTNSKLRYSAQTRRQPGWSVSIRKELEEAS